MRATQLSARREKYQFALCAAPRSKLTGAQPAAVFSWRMSSPAHDAGRSRPLTRRAARLQRLVRTSPPACGRFALVRGLDAFSRLDDSIPIHVFGWFNVSRARVPGRKTGRYAPRERQKVCVWYETRPHRADPGRASPGTVWPAHGLTRQLCARFTPLHEPLCRRRGRFAAFRRSQTAETGGKDVRCPGGNSVRAASFRFAALHETVRPHSKLPAMG
jgi:hypothetical protein